MYGFPTLAISFVLIVLSLYLTLQMRTLRRELAATRATLSASLLKEKRLTFMSMHDALTGVCNRAFFDEELKRFEAAGIYPLTIIVTDVDGLKLLNDTLGHGMGDEILRAYAKILLSTFRTSDVISRIGGDEFAIILPQADAVTGQRRASNLADRVWAHNAGAQDLPLSVSVGVATAIDSSISVDELLRLADRRMYEDKLRHANSSTRGLMKVLLGTLAAKDHIAEGHTARMAKLAGLMATSVGVSQKSQSDLALLSEIHDIGLVGTPESILTKPDALTDEEREIMRQHSAIGHKIALSSPEFSPIARLVLHHHEWWDGSGYPLGLQGDKIPVECRILAIVDAYDAMTSDRPYRKAVDASSALGELQRQAGVQFDPTLVDAFVSIIQETNTLGPS